MATWPVLRAALRLGRDIRVGLEDTVVLEDGRLASGNRELVQAATRLADEVQPPVGLTGGEAVVCTPLVMPASRPGRTCRATLGPVV